ncbi:mesencephalic astrocyte-derived neurotrophic factor homolog [Lingula anatina]|uniref:Mesencephalic astrocyte-derived neurotrophic factor homolog n=1 Tax=Lingula anatina TaxID=7574 RepID=A0A1S3JRG7_LINAN|nr:mesencephalic astrocyte-derived neurotrophic factor homolog [Lingula anatina]|eukprot:XP_013412980.1 mesencephalic astrocyte-derived neurotrophic factor homolog [Lingula anatina]
MDLNMTLLYVCAGVLGILALTSTTNALKEEDCPVCIKFLTKFMNTLEGEEKTVENIEKKFRKFCKSAKNKDERLCYYIGALETSATGILGEMSKPMSWGVPADKVCEKLNRKDSQICELRYPKVVDLATVNLKKLKVKDLKNILNNWGEECKGCAEKSDFIRKIEELMPEHAPEAHAARTKEEL